MITFAMVLTNGDGWVWWHYGFAWLADMTILGMFARGKGE